jgi:hypothetical protein
MTANIQRVTPSEIEERLFAALFFACIAGAAILYGFTLAAICCRLAAV